jgi:predicted secreted protein
VEQGQRPNPRTNETAAMNIHKMRIAMLFVQTILAAVYILGFFLTAQFRDGVVDSREATEGAWTVGYMLGPVLIAFYAYYLGDGADKRMKAEKNRTMAASQVAVILLIFTVFHAIILYYFYFFVWAAEYNFSQKPGNSFIERASFGYKILLMLGAFPLVGVNYLLNRKDVAMDSAVT